MAESDKTADALSVADFEASPVWEFTNDEVKDDETLVRPVRRLPVTSLLGRLVGTRVALANGRRSWAILGNVDVASPRSNEHLLTISVDREGHWFHLARYHDFNWAESGPDALAEFLGLLLDEVFPIAYDIRQFAKGDPRALHGVISKEPSERLSRAGIIALAAPRRPAR